MLTVKQVENLGEGVYADRGGLYLQVQKSSENRLSKTWGFRFTLNGKRRLMGLGSIAFMGLKDAREHVAELAALVRRGQDPIVARRRARKASTGDTLTTASTFRQVAEAYIAEHAAAWTHPKQRQQWENSLATYAYPELQTLTLAQMTTADVQRVLAPIWKTKTETATRVRMRISKVWTFGRAKELCTGDDPAAWKGNLQHLLADPGKVRKVEHMAALPFTKLPEFMPKLRAANGTSARALELLILTACRTGEVLKAEWSEFDLVANVWTIPPERMKAKKEHRVPLSAEAVAVVRRAQLEATDSRLVFPGAREGKPLSDMALLMLLRGMEMEITAHGFRSSFRDWAAEATDYPHEMAEMALAHAIGSKVEAAYRRGDMLEKRRQMMQDWAKHCGGPAA